MDGLEHRTDLVYGALRNPRGLGVGIAALLLGAVLAYFSPPGRARLLAALGMLIGLVVVVLNSWEWTRSIVGSRRAFGVTKR